ncbi:MAG: hypothetical protein J0I90_00395 [Nitrosospira sp.]|nr:hypothetical protein [Nitrosospira sp.]
MLYKPALLAYVYAFTSTIPYWTVNRKRMIGKRGMSRTCSLFPHFPLAGSHE